MAPKRAKEHPGRRLEPQTKKQRTQPSTGKACHTSQIRVQIVTVSGQTLMSLSVEPSCSVQQLLDKLSPLVGNQDQSEHARSKIPHLLHDTTRLAPHQTLGDCVPTDSLLTLTFEVAPVPLRSVERKMSQLQATAEALRLQQELEERENAVAEATANVDKATARRAKLQEKICALQAEARSAEKSLEHASGTLRLAQLLRASVSRKLMEVKQDESPGYERVLERLKPAIAKGDVDVGAKAMLDLCDMLRAGEVSDEELASATNLILASKSVIMQTSAMTAILTLYKPDAEDAPPPSHFRLLQELSAQIVASTLVADGSQRIPWIPLAKAICMNSEATAAVVLVDGVVVRAKAMLQVPTGKCPVANLMYPVLELLRSASLPAASNLEEAISVELEAAHSSIDWIQLARAICKNGDGVLAGPLVEGVMAHAIDGEAMLPAGECPVADLMYPVLELLRSASFPAASKLEAAIGVELEAAHSSIDWIQLARAICKNGDAALAGPLVEGVMARVQMLRLVPASEAPNCPLLDLLHPILENLRAAGLPVAEKVQANFKGQLQALAAEPVPDAPDYALCKEADIVGNRLPGLRDFLLSSVQAQATFDAALNDCVDLQVKLTRLDVSGNPSMIRLGVSKNLSIEVKGLGKRGSFCIRKHCPEQRDRLTQLCMRRDRCQQALAEMM